MTDQNQYFNTDINTETPKTDVVNYNYLNPFDKLNLFIKECKFKELKEFIDNY